MISSKSNQSFRRYASKDMNNCYRNLSCSKLIQFKIENIIKLHNLSFYLLFTYPHIPVLNQKFAQTFHHRLPSLGFASIHPCVHLCACLSIRPSFRPQLPAWEKIVCKVCSFFFANFKQAKEKALANSRTKTIQILRQNPLNLIDQTSNLPK